MDKKKGILNISASIASRIILLVVALYVRRLLIFYIGNEVNGLNSLYGSIIGLLSVAELGVGSAIVFSMYNPIVNGDKQKITALYCLYRKLYRIIGAVILVAGLVVMPFLPKLISDYGDLDINVYVTYLLTLASVVISYLYSAKTSLIEAYKDNYITTGITTASRMIRYALQIATIIIWKSFVIFLVCQIIETLIMWYLTERMVKKLHPDIISLSKGQSSEDQPAVDLTLDPDTRNEVTKNIKAMFMHKIGTILVGAVDSMVISIFIGVTILGKYTNYTAIVGAMTGTIALFFTPMTTVIGHLCAAGKTDETKKYFDYFYTLNYVLGVVFFLGYYAVIDNAVALLFGGDLQLIRMVPFIITINTFISYMRHAQLLFKDASGNFYYDRWKPVIEGCVNLVLSVFFVKIFPPEYGVVGVIAATIVTTLLICDIVEPHILYKYVFKQSALKFCVINYSRILVFTGSLLIMDRVMMKTGNNIVELVINGFISVGISAGLLVLLCIVDKNFRRDCLVILRQTWTWILKLFRR